MAKSEFLGYIEERMYLARYSKRTIETYLTWIKAYIIFHNKKHPSKLGNEDVESFLSYLALERNVAVQTQKLALNALSYLYKHILKTPLDLSFVKTSMPRKLPVALTQQEVQKLLQSVDANYYVLAALMYGSGLRLMESIRLRIKDSDFDYRCIRVWNGKGAKHCYSGAGTDSHASCSGFRS